MFLNFQLKKICGNVFWIFYNLIFYISNFKKRCKDITASKNATRKYHLGRVEAWTEEFVTRGDNNTVGRHALLTIPDHGLTFCSCQSYLYMVTMEITNLTSNYHRFSLDFHVHPKQPIIYSYFNVKWSKFDMCFVNHLTF